MSKSEQLIVRSESTGAVLDLVGDINAGADTAMQAAWDEAMLSQPTTVTLNFERTGYINSTGIAVIVGILAKARASGIALRAHGLSPHYREIFEITRLADFMTIEPNDGEPTEGEPSDGEPIDGETTDNTTHGHTAKGSPRAPTEGSMT